MVTNADFYRAHGRWNIRVTAPRWVIEDFVREYNESGIFLANYGGSYGAGSTKDTMHSMVVAPKRNND